MGRSPGDRTGHDSIDQLVEKAAASASSLAAMATGSRNTDEAFTDTPDGVLSSIAAPAVSAGQVTSQATRESGTAAHAIAQLPAVVCDLVEQARVSSAPRRVVVPLDPPALGHVTVEIIVRADSVKVSLQHGDDAAFAALNAQRPAIAAALESSGLHLSGFDVSSNQRRHAMPDARPARRFETFVDTVEPDGALRL
jgi:flagellar hook-length control protein FliK